MSVWRLLTREILYRKLNFLLAVLSVVMAVGCLVAELTLLRRHDQATEEIVARKEQETQTRVAALEGDTRARVAGFEADTRARMRKLEDDYRKITLTLGFNLLIVPKEQSLGELYATGHASAHMPESYASKLAESSVATIQHLLPTLQQKVKWPEQERAVVLVGTRGEVPILHRSEKKPLLERVPKGKVVVGHELSRNLKLAEGDRLKFQGRDFTVHKVHPERGTVDDITLWINLAEAQEILNRPGQINAILALECNCADADRLGTIRKEVEAILPDTQVVELASQALARAEARNRAAAEAKASQARATAEAQGALARAAAEARAAVEAERQSRASLRRQQDAFAAWLIPLVLTGCVVWLGLVTLVNVRERAGEIGILRALGLRSGQVFALFVGRAVLVGLLGALLGYAGGVAVAAAWGESGGPLTEALAAGPELFLGVLAAAPLLSALVCWLPALLAVRQDPAVVLREL